MKDTILFIRKFRKMYPEIDMAIEFKCNFYSFMDGKMIYEYDFWFKNDIDYDYVRLKSKNLRKPFEDKIERTLKKYWEQYLKEQERSNKPKKFIAPD